MTIAPEQTDIGICRHFTTEGTHPYDEVAWERREARISNFRDGTVAFEQSDVEVPSSWSLNATNILAQKYFRGGYKSADREHSLKQVVDRVVDTITRWGTRDGYFVDAAEALAFNDELKHLIVHQKAAFNSPVWFNIGVPNEPQQASACFILAVDDTMSSILNWYVEEGMIFKSGSGAGINLSNLRSSQELLKGGGTASGPVSFMRGADASAGTIKSGGKTRRAAKMVILNVDHPDIEDFIWCKAIEERKARVLRDAGFDMDLDGKDSHSTQYQNANNSVRVTDEFMQAVLDDADWSLKAVATGEIVKTVRARHLMRQIAEATWECADPGMQFDTTINQWHTASNTGRINASNPCSEYMHVDNSACNLASLNLLKFLEDDGRFDIEGFEAAVDVLITAQEILVGNADYPTEKIAETTRRFRQLGLGYANLGAMLMALGLPYDSDEGRAWAGAVTALLTGRAYATSARMAARMGPFAGYTENREPMNRVLRQHRDKVGEIDPEKVPNLLLSAAWEAWEDAVEMAGTDGVRNSQASVMAPTGTIGLLMDCDTTGIEPELGLSKTKKLVGGGTMSIVNQTVPRALRRLGYDNTQIGEVVSYITEHKSIVGAPHVAAEHLPVFACSMGDLTIHHLGHIKMMAAIQPFVSGAISKTVNVPETASVEDLERVYVDAWRMGLKAVAVYRDGSKVAQPLANDQKQPATVERVIEKIVVKEPTREKLKRERDSKTISFKVGEGEGYVTIGTHPDGRMGELFLKMAKQGSTLAGMTDAFAVAVSIGLQYGVPLSTFVQKFTNMRFEPAGMTDDPDIRFATSLVDYIFRKLAIMHMPLEERMEYGILSVNERMQPTLPGTEDTTVPTTHAIDLLDPEVLGSIDSEPKTVHTTPIDAQSSDAPYCYQCGNVMQRAGSCYVCGTCGTTSGCS